MSIFLHRSGLIGGAGAVGGGGGGGTDPYWADVLALWDFTTNSGANLATTGSSYDMVAAGSATIGSGVADLPGTSSDYLRTSATDSDPIIPTGDFAFEFWGVDYDNLTFSADKVLLGVFGAGNTRSFVIRSQNANEIEMVTYQSGTTSPVTVSTASISLSANTPYYFGFFRVTNSIYIYAGSLGTFGSPTFSGTLNYSPFSNANQPMQISGTPSLAQPFDGQMQAVRITNSARGNTGGSWTPDSSFPLPTS